MTDLEQSTAKAGRTVDKTLNADIYQPRVGYALLTFPFGEDLALEPNTPIHYMANLSQDQILKALRMLIAQIEALPKYTTGYTDPR